MPRPNQPRGVHSEANLASRIAHERQTRGWSYETLAAKMAAVECPINASALFRIEKGKPPRRITVDELVAFGQVFEAEPAELLLPIQVVARRDAVQLVEDMNATRRELYRALDAMTLQTLKYAEMARNDDDLGNFIREHVDTYMEQPDPELTSGILLTPQLREHLRQITQEMWDFSQEVLDHGEHPEAR